MPERRSLADRPIVRQTHPIRAVMRDRAISYDDVAAATGYSPHTVKAVLSGTIRSWPSFRAAVADAFARSEQELFADIPPQS